LGAIERTFTNKKMLLLKHYILEETYPDIPMFEFYAEASGGIGKRKKFHGY
jgi:hypothetical protein